MIFSCFFVRESVYRWENAAVTIRLFLCIIPSGNTEKEHLTAFYAILTALLNRENKKEQESSDIDGLIQPLAFAGTANKILEAFGVSMPDQENDDDDDEEEDPNQVTGRWMSPGSYMLEILS